MICPKCKKAELGELFIYKDGEVKISGKVAFHLYNTHGLPPEILKDAINQSNIK